jgi:hypothetical protein
MYYARFNDRMLWIHEAASGAPWFTIGINDNMLDYDVNGNTLVINYSNYVEVYDLNSRSRIR